MSTKIIYRRILPCSSPHSSSQLPHPHKTPSQAPPSSHPHTDSDTVSSSTDNDQNSLTQKSTTENEVVSSLQETEAEGQVSLSSEEKQSSPITTEGTADKIALGEITEIKGVIFDMDGTLTIPVLNFMKIKAQVGLKPTDDILPTVQKMPEKERARAFEIIEKFEKEGVEQMKVSILNICKVCILKLRKNTYISYNNVVWPI